MKIHRNLLRHICKPLLNPSNFIEDSKTSNKIMRSPPLDRPGWLHFSDLDTESWAAVIATWLFRNAFTLRNLLNIVDVPVRDLRWYDSYIYDYIIKYIISAINISFSYLNLWQLCSYLNEADFLLIAEIRKPPSPRSVSGLPFSPTRRHPWKLSSRGWYLLAAGEHKVAQMNNLIILLWGFACIWRCLPGPEKKTGFTCKSKERLMWLYISKSSATLTHQEELLRQCHGTSITGMFWKDQTQSLVEYPLGVAQNHGKIGEWIHFSEGNPKIRTFTIHWSFQCLGGIQNIHCFYSLLAGN